MSILGSWITSHSAVRDWSQDGRQGGQATLGEELHFTSKAYLNLWGKSFKTNRQLHRTS